MSIKIMSQVWELDLKSTDKFVLLALADHSNDDGECYPSYSKIMKKTGLSEQGLRNIINRLISIGLLSREQRLRDNNSVTSNLYKINADTTPHDMGGDGQRGGGTTPNDMGGTPTQDGGLYEPSLNHQLETSVKHLPLTPKSSVLTIHESSTNQTLVQSFIDHRKEIKKPFTQKALDLFTSKLEKLYHEGYDIETIVNDSIIAGYQSVFPNPRHKQHNGVMVPVNKQPWQIEKDRQLALKHSTEAMFEAGLTIFDVIKQRA